ncbi:MAG: hypothetical protein ABIA63_05655 [bacterium]
MSSLQVRELPELIYLELRKQAKKEQRSIAQQAIVTLSRGLGLNEKPQEKRKGIIDKIQNNPIIANGDDYEDPVKLIREDRDR